MYSQIAANKRKTIILMICFIAFMAVFGQVLSLATGRPGLVVALIIGSAIYAFVSYYASASITLLLARARPTNQAESPEFYRVVENLSITAGLPMPKIYIVDDPSPNAFATGRDPEHAVVAATSGLLQMMDKSELEGVMAHELSHVGNYDIRLMAVVVVLVTIISVVSHLFLRLTFWGGDDERKEGQAGVIFLIVGIVLSLVAPLVATVLQLAVSRRREYLADASGTLLTRYPEGLIRALQKISASKPMKTASPATAHLYFASPFKGVGGFMTKLFSTHPSIEDRIARLAAMEDQV